VLISKIAAKGQINIPKSFREALKIENGDYISY